MRLVFYWLLATGYWLLDASSFWPFPIPSANLPALLKDAAQALYFAGARDGAILGVTLCLVLYLLGQAVALAVKKTDKDTTVKVAIVGAILAALLWYAQHKGPGGTAPPSTPKDKPTPARPWFPWRSQ